MTNAVGSSEEQFDKGGARLGPEILKAICRAGQQMLADLEDGRKAMR